MPPSDARRFPKQHLHQIKCTSENNCTIWSAAQTLKAALTMLKIYFRDQSFTTAVTTSSFPNMHTFLSGPEFCFMVRKLFSSCKTSKNLTLEEQYPSLCNLLAGFPVLCKEPGAPSIYETQEDGSGFDHFAANGDGRLDVMQMLLTTNNITIKSNGLK